MSKNIKTKLCINYKKNKECNYGNECKYAHGDSELIKFPCKSYENCWNEYCNYRHKEGWNPYDNKKECFNCIKGFCDKENKIYLHKEYVDNIINNIEDKDINSKSDDNIDYNKDFIFLNDIKKNKNTSEGYTNEINSGNPDIPLTKNIEEIIKNNEKDINNIDVIINNMEEIFNNFNKKVKSEIKNNIKDYNIKCILISDLNKIKSEIKLFKDNYNDSKKELRLED